jgi:hypothetical protein
MKKKKCPQYDNCKKNKEFDCVTKLCDEQKEKEDRALDALIALALRQRPKEIPRMEDLDKIILSKEDKNALKKAEKGFKKFLKEEVGKKGS